MSAVVVFSGNHESHYYELTEKSNPTVIVLGEESEQWTSMVLQYFKTNDVSVFFLPWSKIPDLRLQLELVRYPVVQLWHKKKLVRECVGYLEAELEKLVKLYFLNNKR